MGKKRRRAEGEEQRLDADFERRLAEAVKTVLANAARYKDAIAAALPSRRAPRAAGEQAAGTHGPPPATATAPPQQPRPTPAAAAAPAGPSSRARATAPAARAAAERPAPVLAAAVATAPVGRVTGVAEAAAGTAHTGRPAKQQVRREPQHAATAEPTRQAAAPWAAAGASSHLRPLPEPAAAPTPPPSAHDTARAGPSSAAPGLAGFDSSGSRHTWQSHEMQGRETVPHMREAASSWQQVPAAVAAARLDPSKCVGAHGNRRKWQADELQMILQVIHVYPDGGAAGLNAALKELGWDALPDPDGRIRQRVCNQLIKMRAQLAHGVDPEQVVSTDKKLVAPDMRLTWAAWVRQAFLTFPDYTGTADDVCAYMQANPDIAPLLDKRPCLHARTKLRWRTSVSRKLSCVPGMVKTGEKRNRYAVYVYEPQAAAIKPGVGKRPRKQAGLPHLGKRS